MQRLDWSTFSPVAYPKYLSLTCQAYSEVAFPAFSRVIWLVDSTTLATFPTCLLVVETTSSQEAA